MKEEGDEESLADSLIEGNKVRNQPFFSDPPKYNSRRRSSPPVPFVVYAIVLLISLTVNLFGAVFALYGWNPFPSSSSSSSPSSTTTSQNDNLPASPYSGLKLDTPTIYHHQTDYWGANMTLADELWEDVDTDPMVVALSDDYAAAHGLDLSSRWPWDKSKGRYFLKMFHQLHCLKYIRQNFIDLERKGSSTLDSHHTQHCLDLLRKDVLCYGDDTPMPTNERHTAIGDGQRLMCRNYDRVVAWAYAPERNACHRSLNEYRQFAHPIERYAFCEPGTPYYDTMQAYFDEHGHVDPYEE